MSFRRLGKRRYTRVNRKHYAFSERSGKPYKLIEMVTEPGTGLLVHRSETDGKWNSKQAFKDPFVPADAQQLRDQNGPPESATTPVERLNIFAEPLFLTANISFEVEDDGTFWTGSVVFQDSEGSLSLSLDDLEAQYQIPNPLSNTGFSSGFSSGFN